MSRRAYAAESRWCKTWTKVVRVSAFRRCILNRFERSASQRNAAKLQPETKRQDTSSLNMKIHRLTPWCSVTGVFFSTNNRSGQDLVYLNRRAGGRPVQKCSADDAAASMLRGGPSAAPTGPGRARMAVTFTTQDLERFTGSASFYPVWGASNLYMTEGVLFIYGHGCGWLVHSIAQAQHTLSFDTPRWMQLWKLSSTPTGRGRVQCRREQLLDETPELLMQLELDYVDWPHGHGPLELWVMPSGERRHIFLPSEY